MSKSETNPNDENRKVEFAKVDLLWLSMIPQCGFRGYLSAAGFRELA
jgi:hypothetical protein